MDSSFENWKAGIIASLINRCRLLLRLATVVFVGGSGLAVVAIHAVSQKNVTTAALMYLPPWIWLIPALSLAPIAALIDRKTLLFHLGAVVLFLGFQLRWFSPGERQSLAPDGTLRVLCWNAGQGPKGEALGALTASEPDILILQETKTSRFSNHASFRNYPFCVGLDDFVMLSRWPVIETNAIEPPNSSFRRSHIVRHLVNVPHIGPCAVYSVHFPSPRDVLSSYKRGAFLWGILGFPGSPWEEKRIYNQYFWDQYILLAHTLAQALRSEVVPFIVAGDFNSPDYGHVYNIASDGLIDCHQMAGEGPGFTFPGYTNNPLAFFRPWLRLDQVFASQHWTVGSSQVQKFHSQHLPVVVELATDLR